MRRQRDSKGRFVKRSRARRHTRRRTTRRRTVMVGTRRPRKVRVARHPVLVNPRRRRRSRTAYVMNRRRRHYRRNPRVSAIFSAPTLKHVGFAMAGLAGVPVVEGFVVQYLPTTLTTNRWGNYAVKIGIAAALGWGADKVIGREAGRDVLIGGLSYVGLIMVKDFFPALMGGTAPAATGRYLGVGAQRLLGRSGEYASAGGNITTGVPDRLSPASRF